MNASEAAESHVEFELTDSHSSSVAKDAKENVASKAFAEFKVTKVAPLLETNTKKPYGKPVVKVYGTVGVFTAAVGGGSFNPDGGLSGSMVKTH